MLINCICNFITATWKNKEAEKIGSLSLYKQLSADLSRQAINLLRLSDLSKAKVSFLIC